MGIKKRWISRWFRIRWKSFKKMNPKKVISKNVTEKSVYLSRKVKYGRIVMPERVVFDHRPPSHGRVQSLRGLPLVSLFTRAHSDTLFCAAGHISTFCKI